MMKKIKTEVLRCFSALGIIAVMYAISIVAGMVAGELFGMAVFGCLIGTLFGLSLAVTYILPRMVEEGRRLAPKTDREVVR